MVQLIHLLGGPFSGWGGRCGSMGDRGKKPVDGTLSFFEMRKCNHDLSVIVVIDSVVNILFRGMYSVLWMEITWATPWLYGLYPVPSHRVGEDFLSEE